MPHSVVFDRTEEKGRHSALLLLLPWRSRGTAGSSSSSNSSRERKRDHGSGSTTSTESCLGGGRGHGPEEGGNTDLTSAAFGGSGRQNRGGRRERSCSEKRGLRNKWGQLRGANSLQLCEGEGGCSWEGVIGSGDTLPPPTCSFRYSRADTPPGCCCGRGRCRSAKKGGPCEKTGGGLVS